MRVARLVWLFPIQTLSETWSGNPSRHECLFLFVCMFPSYQPVFQYHATENPEKVKANMGYPPVLTYMSSWTWARRCTYYYCHCDWQGRDTTPILLPWLQYCQVWRHDLLTLGRTLLLHQSGAPCGSLLIQHEINTTEPSEQFMQYKSEFHRKYRVYNGVYFYRVVYFNDSAQSWTDRDTLTSPWRWEEWTPGSRSLYLRSDPDQKIASQGYPCPEFSVEAGNKHGHYHHHDVLSLWPGILSF